MAEGSLVVNIQTLQEALAGINMILGAAGGNGAPGTGLAGAAGLAATSPADRVGNFAANFQQQIAGVLTFDSTTGLTQAATFFTTLQSAVQAPPTAALTTFQQQLTQADALFAGDFVQQLQAALDAILNIAQRVPDNPTGVVSALLDQILAVLGSMAGPEAETIRSWLQSIQEMQRTLLPLIEQAQNNPDPTAVLIEVLQRALDGTLELFGFEEIQRFLRFLDTFNTRLLPPELHASVNSTLAATVTAYAQPRALVGGAFPAFRDSVVSAGEAMQDLKAELDPLLSALRRVVQAKIFQPHALENYLRERLESALAVEVREVQEINDPFTALFDRMDAAIAGIDLDFVRNDVLGFFTETRTIITQVNLPALGSTLQTQLQPVAGAITTLQQGVADLLAQIKAFFANLLAQVRTLAGNLGTFQPDGRFEYQLAQQLRGVLTQAQTAIAGDPSNPSAPSVAGALNEFHGVIDQFLAQLGNLLQPVQGAVTDVVNSAVTGINNFSAFLQGLNVAALMEQLRQKVAEILDALLPIDFDSVVEPVVALIEENAAKLQSIDPASLNDLLREALKVALDVVISIDFSVSITQPLTEQFAAIKQLPQQAIDQLQARYESALSLLDALNPSQLLEALFAAFDLIQAAVGSLNVTALLQPLDDLHAQFLQQPLAQLKPSTLLQPLVAGFQSVTNVFDEIDATALLAPLTSQLAALQQNIANFDITGWIDDLLAALATVQQSLRSIRPSTLLQPLVADFARLEGELDRFNPSTIFAPVTALAAPLLQLLETIQQETINALFALFQAPLQLLERLEPERLEQAIVQQIDAVLAALRALNVPTRYLQLKGHYFDLNVAVQGQTDERRIDVAVLIDPDVQIGPLIDDYNALVAALEGLKSNVPIAEDLRTLYNDLRTRLLDLLPPYARALLDPVTFKRLMRLADPTRFLAELDQRFTAIKDKLLPIRPEDLTAELDATYDAVLALVDNLDISASLNQVKTLLNQLTETLNLIRVDFLAADINKAIADLRSLVEALNPANLLTDLDAIHLAVEGVVQNTRPSQVLADLQTLLTEVQTLITSLDPRLVLGQPLNQAWAAVEGVLDDIDFTIVLEPLVEKLAELEAAFTLALSRTEDAFDEMLTGARSALGGSVSVSVGGSIG